MEDIRRPDNPYTDILQQEDIDSNIIERIANEPDEELKNAMMNSYLDLLDMREKSRDREMKLLEQEKRINVLKNEQKLEEMRTKEKIRLAEIFLREQQEERERKRKEDMLDRKEKVKELKKFVTMKRIRADKNDVDSFDDLLEEIERYVEDESLIGIKYIDIMRGYGLKDRQILGLEFFHGDEQEQEQYQYQQEQYYYWNPEEQFYK